MAQSRIRWTPQERILLIDKVIEYRKLHIGATISTALQEAQKSLPSSRRRNYLQFAKSTNARFFRELDKAESKPAPIIDQGPDVVQVEVPITPDIERLMRDIPSSMLLANLAERWFQWIDGISRGWLSVNHRPAPASAPAMVPRYPGIHGVPRNDGTRIAIVGLLRDQFAEVVTKTGHLPMKLMYVERDLARPKIPVSAEHVIITRFSKHHWDTIARQQMSRDRVHYLQGGGIQTVIKTILDIHSRIVSSNGHTLQPVV